MSPTPLPEILAAIERHRLRIWALCYRMTGSRVDADDLCQEALARAIERGEQLEAATTVEGWLFRIATTVCLDHARHSTVVRRLTQLVDPLDLPDLPFGDPGAAAEDRAILREDVRYAVVVALQTLSPKQRAALVLHDVCGRTAEEVGATIGISANSVKALLHRARASLARARRRTDVDVPADRAVVERMAAAIEAGSIDALAQIFAEEVWGMVDGGGIIQASNRPNLGRRAVSRQWANAQRKLGGVQVTAEIRVLNGEPALILRVPAFGNVVTAIVHVETHNHEVAAIRTNRDPTRLRFLAPA
jgi:RNA polymerase sigma-70 factor (ECF subfamily)